MRIGEILGRIVVFLFILAIIVVPFFEKGVVVPKEISGKEIGRAFGQNIRNFLTFYAEAIEGFARSFLEDKDP